MALPEFKSIDIQNAMRVLCYSLGRHQLRFLGAGDLVELDGILMRTQDATDKLMEERKNGS